MKTLWSAKIFWKLSLPKQTKSTGRKKKKCLYVCLPWITRSYNTRNYTKFKLSHVAMALTHTDIYINSIKWIDGDSLVPLSNTLITVWVREWGYEWAKAVSFRGTGLSVCFVDHCVVFERQWVTISVWECETDQGSVHVTRLIIRTLCLCQVFSQNNACIFKTEHCIHFSDIIAHCLQRVTEWSV